MKFELAKQTKLYTKLSLAVMTLLASPAVWASDYYVAPTAAGDCSSAANACEFQTSLDMARTNIEPDTVHVAAGTYNITSRLRYEPSSGEDNSSLTILGDGAESTILDGGSSTSIMVIDLTSLLSDLDTDISISGITFQNGGTVDDWWIESGTAKGLNILTNSADIMVVDTNISFSGVVISSQYGNIALMNNTINDNINGTYMSGPAAIDASSQYGNITLSKNIFKRNNESFSLGAVRIGSVYGNVTVDNNTFSDNRAFDWSDGALSLYSGGDTTIINNIFTENDSGRGGGGGMALRLSHGNNAVVNNIFYRNNGPSGAGGAYIALLEDGSITLTNNTIIGNYVGGYGDKGGGVWITLKSNTAKAELYNNIIWDNKSPGDDTVGKDLYVSSDRDGDGTGSIVKLYNNNLGINSDFTSGQSADLYITNTDNYTHASNLKEDPLFVDEDNGDFHLTDDSPLIDVGDLDAPMLPERDFEGDARVIGDAPDIGADEFAPVTIEGVLHFFDEAVSNGTLVGVGPGKSADNRLNAFRNMLLEANERDFNGACGQLNSVYIHSDGNSKPKDLIGGDAISEFSSMLLELKANYGCE